MNVYLPDNPESIDKILIAVHGIRRDVSTIASELIDIAHKAQTALVIPFFDQDYFPAYQRIVDSPERLRPDHLLNSFIECWKSAFCKQSLKVHLFGFSGGAQFSHRYAFLNPERVSSVILASAGWYTLPTFEIRYPYGIQNFPRSLGRISLRKILSLNIATLVGVDDLDRDESVRQGGLVDALQGKNRLERAQKWCELFSAQRGRFFEAYPEMRPIIVPGVSHDVGKMLRSPSCKKALLDKLANG